jgi:hypothetical protein
VLSRYRKPEAETENDPALRTYFLDTMFLITIDEAIRIMGWVMLGSILIRIVLVICNLMPEALDEVNKADTIAQKYFF